MAAKTALAARINAGALFYLLRRLSHPGRIRAATRPPGRLPFRQPHDGAAPQRCDDPRWTSSLVVSENASATNLKSAGLLDPLKEPFARLELDNVMSRDLKTLPCTRIPSFLRSSFHNTE